MLSNKILQIKTVIVSIFLIYIYGCSSQSTPMDWDVNDFRTIQGEEYNPDIFLGRPYDLVVANGMLFILDPYDGVECTVIDLDRKTQIARILPIGNGPGEVRPPLYISHDKKRNYLEVYEVSDSKFLYYSMHQETNDFSFIQDTINNKVKFGKYCTNVQRLESGLYIASGAFEKGPMRLFNHKGDPIAEFGAYPLLKKESTLKLNFLFLSAQSNMICNPAKDHVVLAGLYSDQLLFYKINDTIPIKVKEYFSTEAEVKILESGNKTGLIQTEKSTYYYKNLYPSDSLVYALYWGAKAKEVYEEKKVSECYILAFDWSGNFRKGYRIPYLLAEIAVDENTNILFGITTGLEYNIKLLRFEL